MGHNFLDTSLKMIPFFPPSCALPRFNDTDREAAETELDLIIELSRCVLMCANADLCNRQLSC